MHHAASSYCRSPVPWRTKAGCNGCNLVRLFGGDRGPGQTDQTNVPACSRLEEKWSVHLQEVDRRGQPCLLKLRSEAADFPTKTPDLNFVWGRLSGVG